jgi:predicted XRE-type DNA-binding protein
VTTFHDDVRQWVEDDPEFAHELELARGESRLGEQIAAMREARGYTQRELGERMGVKQPSVARLEGADRTPTAETIWRVTDALDCEITFGPRHTVRITPVFNLNLETAVYPGWGSGVVGELGTVVVADMGNRITLSLDQVAGLGRSAVQFDLGSWTGEAVPDEPYRRAGSSGGQSSGTRRESEFSLAA